MKMLKQLRESQKSSQAKLAEKLGLPLTTYHNYEIGRNEPNIETLCKLADYYNVSLDYLVGRDFNNEFGYLSEEEKNIITNYRQMNDSNKVRFVAESYGVLIGQS